MGIGVPYALLLGTAKSFDALKLELDRRRRALLDLADDGDGPAVRESEIEFGVPGRVGRAGGDDGVCHRGWCPLRLWERNRKGRSPEEEQPRYYKRTVLLDYNLITN